MRSKNLRRRAAAVLVAAICTISSAVSTAQGPGPVNYPSRPLRLIVPFAPGGGNDILARILATQLAAGLRQQVLVDNRPGGAGIIATEVVAKASPDGYTLLLGFMGPLAISPAFTQLPYDPVRDFVPLDLLATSYHILVVNPSVPARSVQELIELAKSQPGKLNYASSGLGANLHLMTELFKTVAGVDIVHVPYKGSGPAANAVLAGEAQLLFGSITSSLPHVRANRLVALAVTSPMRSPLAPDVPTLMESGVRGVDVPSWYTLLVPARTPREAPDKLRAELRRIASTAGFREQLARQAIEVRTLAPGEYAEFLKAEIEKWGKVVRSKGLKAE
jgi:tripartite-type tricarboxylate transporter receptor subunit TctC